MRDRLNRLSLPDWAPPLLLLGLAVLAYGVLLPWLGYYWDEWPLTWIGHRLGGAGLERYFYTNRPYWGLVYRLTMPVLGETPWHWQVFGLFWRWLSAVLFWAVVKTAWPDRKDLAAGAGVLFLLYPGFSQQSGGLMYGHFFIVMCAWLGSLLAGLLSVMAWPQDKRRFFLLAGLAIVLEEVNLFTMEYFFLLELLRLPLVAAVCGSLMLREGAAHHPRQKAWRRAFKFCIPYLVVFLAAAAWRGFFFPYQTQNYETGLLDRLGADPWLAITSLLGRALSDLARVTGGALLKAVRIPTPALLGLRSFLVYAVLALAAGLFCLAGLWLVTRKENRPAKPRQASLSLLGLGLLALLLGGAPFWVTDLPVTLGFPYDRFNLAFAAGYALLVSGFLGLASLGGRRLAVVVALIAGLCSGLHFQEASTYRRDWNQLRTLFWQMSWRIPALQSGTTLVSSILPLRFYSDNSLAGPLNWVYDPKNTTVKMAYMFYYASIRAERKLLFKPDQPIVQDYLAASFEGSTAQMTALVFTPPACLRILDPDLDPLNYMISADMRQASELSRSRWILTEAGQPPDLTPVIFGEEPAHAWCYYYEKAALAADQGDWPLVAELGDIAFGLGDYPNDPMERLPFVEGYAHTGAWERAMEISGEAAQITPLMQPMLCRLWERIGEETLTGQAGRDEALAEARMAYCR